MLFNIHKLTWDKRHPGPPGHPRACCPRWWIPPAWSARWTRPSWACTHPHRRHRRRPAGRPCSASAASRWATRKNTYGTGCFLLMNTGDAPVKSQTACYHHRLGHRRQGAVLPGGQHLCRRGGDAVAARRAGPDPVRRRGEQLACRWPTPPGSTWCRPSPGWARPYWDMYSRGIMVGLTRGANQAHILARRPESIAYQARTCWPPCRRMWA